MSNVGFRDLNNNLIGGTVAPQAFVAWTQERCWWGTPEVKALVRTSLVADGAAAKLKLSTSGVELETVDGQVQKAACEYKLEWKNEWKKKLPSKGGLFVLTVSIAGYGIEKVSPPLFVDFATPLLSA